MNVRITSSIFATIIALIAYSTHAEDDYQNTDEGFAIFRGAESLLLAHDFNALEKLAKNYRVSKMKVKGGNSALFYFYPGLATAGIRNEFQGSTLSSDKRPLLEEWLAHKPHSVTARIALAAYWNSIGWEARGTARANEVTGDQSNIFGNDLLSAQHYLDGIDVGADPEIYYLLIQIAMGTSSSRPQLDSLYQHAIATHPDFFHYYSQRANTLQAKWYGEPGDIKIFAQSVLTMPGGETGSIAYAYIATRLLDCHCEDIFHKIGLSWLDVKAGYDARLSKYGLRNRDWNALCLLAASAGATQDAKQALDHIGDNWDQSIWTTRKNFDAAVNWISSGIPTSTSKPGT